MNTAMLPFYKLSSHLSLAANILKQYASHQAEFGHFYEYQVGAGCADKKEEKAARQWCKAKHHGGGSERKNSANKNDRFRREVAVRTIPARRRSTARWERYV